MIYHNHRRWPCMCGTMYCFFFWTAMESFLNCILSCKDFPLAFFSFWA